MEENLSSWELNDFKVDDLRRRMVIVRELYRGKNPNISEDALDAYISRIFKNESFQLLKEQMSIISVGMVRR